MNKWIKVSSPFKPKNKTKVLIHEADKGIRIATYSQDDNSFVLLNEGDIKNKNITHWMEMVEDPKPSRHIEGKLVVKASDSLLLKENKVLINFLRSIVLGEKKESLEKEAQNILDSLKSQK